MKPRVFALALLALMFAAFPALAAKQAQHGQHAAPPASTPQARQSVTEGSVTAGGQHINYKAITGIAIIKNDKGEPYTSMSYVAYVKKGVKDETRRPITFFYNGGPGSSTVWLHMLAFGPKLVKVGNGTLTPPAPYKMVNNDESLLDATDEVFIDMPGTGFGRIITKKMGGVGTPKKVWGIDADAEAFTRFISQYLSDHGRWNSPKFLFGESYGTTRSAVLSWDLEQANVGLNGVMLLSSILNFDLSVDGPQRNPGVNLSYATGLPSYAATAWYHGKLPGEAGPPATASAAATAARPGRSNRKLASLLKKVEHFAMNDYLLALDKGNRIAEADKKQIAQKMHQYTGLPVAYILKANLKVTGGQFAHELLSDDDDITGRLDSRFSGPTMDPMAESAHYDPLDSAIDAPTIAEFNAYLRNTLKFGKGMHYRPSVYRQIYTEAGGWNQKHRQPGSRYAASGTPNVMPDLAAAMKHNPNLKVLLAGGYMDLGTPFYAAQYEMHQLPIPQKLQKNISYAFFPSGHMVYVNPKAHKGLHDAAAKFIEANSTAHAKKQSK